MKHLYELSAKIDAPLMARKHKTAQSRRKKQKKLSFRRSEDAQRKEAAAGRSSQKGEHDNACDKNATT